MLWLMLGCLTRQDVVRAPQATPTVVAPVMGYVDKRAVEAAPEGLTEAVLTELEKRNLPPTVVGADRWGESFETRRTTSHRLEALTDAAGAAHLVVLVETEASYFSQMNGRYRWTVDVVASVAPSDAPDQALTHELSVPVFLDFYHQREPEAVAAGAAVIGRHVGSLLDAYLGGL